MLMIREAIAADLPILLGIYNHYVLTSTATPICDPLTKDEQRHWFETQMVEGLPILVAERDGGVVGYCHVGRLMPIATFAPSLEEHIYLDPGHVGCGFGTLLLRAMIDRVGQLGVRTVIARIDASNEASLRLHRKCGFETIGTVRDIAYKNATLLSFTIMQYLFEAPTGFGAAL